ncbi:MAG: thiamine pyrophosphate-binding protein [Cyanothece sp. SIO2G6]|nr:thiamine pyrophosphate-binding protein [Cyanothece sp. SIO2G6]
MRNQNQPKQRWARDYVYDILRKLDICYIFGVPGTNEIPIIDGTSYPENQVQYIECLHENIAMGAAMGSACMTGKPGIVVVHVTPGIAHGIGNLFNAYRSQIPLVIICAQQQNELVTQEPLLSSNLVQLAEQYCKWAHEIRAPEEIPLVLQRAFKEAMAPPPGPVFLSVPWEYMMREIGENDKIEGITHISPNFIGDEASITEAANALRTAKNPIIVGGDAIGYEDAWEEMQELAELIGAPVVLQTFSSRANFPNNDYHWQGELPGNQAKIQEIFQQHDVAFLCGYHAQAQVAVFKYSEGPLIPKSVKQIYLSNNTWDLGKNYYGSIAIMGGIKATLSKINKLIRENLPPKAAERNKKLKSKNTERVTAWKNYLQEALVAEEIWAVVIADALRKAIEKNDLAKKFVYVHEAVSDPAPFQYLLPLGTKDAKPLSYYCVTGGSLGWSMPASLGIKLEHTGYQGIETQLVINAVGDGSSLFYSNVWWTAAHKKLAVLYIITNNHEYHTLQLGLQEVITAYGNAPGYNWKPKTPDPDYLRLEYPKIDFVSLAKAYGIADGQVIKQPKDVCQAVKIGVGHVLTKKTSYILDMRIAQETPAPPPSSQEVKKKEYLQRYYSQPPLNVFHNSVDKKTTNQMSEEKERLEITILF